MAVLGELGATPGDVPLAGPAGSLRAGLVALVTNILQAMGHRHGEARRLRHALATTGTVRATTEATPGPAVVPPGNPAVPRTTAGDPWATVAAITREWQKAVALVEATWATVAGDATHLRDACGTAATAEATPGVTACDLAAAVAREDAACQELLEATATRALPVASEVATVAEVLTAHRARVAEASAGLQVATKATEKTVVATVESMAAGERSRRAAVAHEPLGRLVAACHKATYLYCHLRRWLEHIEATVAAGHGGPEAPEVTQEVPGGPRATVTVQGGLGGPEDLLAAVTVAEALWDASARLAKGHLQRTLREVRGLLVTPDVPDATVAATVVQHCQDATAAIPGLLLKGP